MTGWTRAWRRAGATILAAAMAGCAGEAGSEASQSGDVAGQDTASGSDGASNSDGSSGGDAVSNVPSELAIEGLPEGDATAALPDGTYASRQRFTNKVLLPPFGDPDETTQTAWVLHEVRHEAGVVKVQTRACAISEPTKNGVTTVFPATLIAALPVWETEVKSYARVSGGFVVDWAPQTTLLGCTLSDPSADPLPDKADDPAVVDADKDGNPGGTVKLEGLISGAIYVVQRSVEHLRGVTVQDGLDGLMLGTREQSIVGASEAVLASFDLQATKHPDPKRSDFHLRKVTDGTDCAALLAAPPPLPEGPAIP
jgi:hypothetical protein